ncbi:MAG: rhodanese-like domain-containing protein [Alphaproteobacteria bacterium]
MKTAKDYLDAANTVPRVSAEEGIAIHKAGDTVFVDVRDSSEIEASGTIEGALRISRGFIEFAADPATPYHNKALQKDAKIALVCGAGGQAALTGKTMQDMGYTAVVNVGGIGDWKDADGPMES